MLKPILAGLYYPRCPYEFSVLPAEILGQVYEQFLGKVIRLTPAHRAEVEEKPEVKKAGGVYYTPAYIVDYIVEQTVGELVEGKSPRQIRGRGASRRCGSSTRPAAPARSCWAPTSTCWTTTGSWYEEHDPEKHAAGKEPAVYQGPGGDWRLTTAEKKRILLNNIYGVDIDRQAVEVTKLSLLLKVLEGETEETLGQQLTLWRERALPDLGDNIKCGNSLIGPDYFEGQLLPDEEEVRRVNPFDWEAEFPEAMAAGGFDGVIGNPPYGASLSVSETEYLLSSYPLQQYQLDTYLLFIERALQLLREEGGLGMIIPNTWLLNLQSNNIRERLFNCTKISAIVHYRSRVFRKATVDTEVVVFWKQTPSEDHRVQITVVNKDGSRTSYPIEQRRWRGTQGMPVNIFERPEFQPIADRLRALPSLDEICAIRQGAKPFQTGKGKPPQTWQTVKDKPFVSEAPQDSTFRPLLRGSLMNRYRIMWDSNYWISFGDWLAEPRYSAQYDAPEKIVIRQTGDSLVATLDRSQFIVRDNLYAIVPHSADIDPRYVLGVLNSRLLNWYYQTILNPERGEALAQVKRGHLAQLPMAQTDTNNPTAGDFRHRLCNLVERMLGLHEALAAATVPADKALYERQIGATDRQIDRWCMSCMGWQEGDPDCGGGGEMIHSQPAAGELEAYGWPATASDDEIWSGCWG